MTHDDDSDGHRDTIYLDDGVPYQGTIPAPHRQERPPAMVKSPWPNR